ncbi:MAG TPA: hypothetical protein VMU18_03715, partial [Rhodoblastus sp.]|nr:hypothetical protein [Rhodoblastus sp.]
KARIAASLAGGLAVLAITFALFPQAAHGPFAGLDPELRAFWLRRVNEVQPFFAYMRDKPVERAAWLVPFVAALAGVLLNLRLSAKQGDEPARDRWLLLGALLLAGAAVAAIELRVVSSMAPLVALATLGLIAALRRALMARHTAFGGPAALLIALFALSNFGVASAALYLMPAPPPGAAPPAGPPTLAGGCLRPDAFAPLATLPPGLAIAPIETGPYLLAHTPHAVVAAPYHRDNQGNLLALHVLTGKPEAAATLARASGARWLLVCAGADPFLKAYLQQNPEGLTARLVAGKPPAWLKAVPLQGTPYRAFEIAPADH